MSAKLAIENVSVADLKPYSGNARKHSPKQIAEIASSIKAFGFNNPVLIDKAGTIIAGHGRVEAAKKLGVDSVPCLRLEHLTDAQKRAYILADNKLAEKAGWDREILAIELQHLTTLDLDFDVTITGFEMAEIDVLLGEAEAKTDAADAVPPLADGPAVTRLGDLWQIGAHRLICGDATDLETSARLLDGERAQMVFTDPPYNVKINGHVSGLGAVKRQGVGDFEHRRHSGLAEHAFAILGRPTAGILKQSCRHYSLGQSGRGALVSQPLNKRAGILNNLANTYDDQGKYAEAERLHERALAVFEKVFGRNHPSVAGSLNNLAKSYVGQGRYGEAEALLKRSLVIYEQVFGREHPDVGHVLRSIGLRDLGRKQWASAYISLRRAVAIKSKRYLDAADQEQRVRVDPRKERLVYHNLASAAWGLSESEPERRFELMREAFEAAQWSGNSEVGAALTQMAVRFSTETAIGRAVRERQDLTVQWRALDKKLVAALSAPPGQRDERQIADLRAAATAAETQLADASVRLDKEFPTYSELASPVPLAIADAQQLLDPNEALIVFLAHDELETLVWAVTREKAEWRLINVGAKKLAEEVTHLRKPLDLWAKIVRGLARPTADRSACAPHSGNEIRGLGRADVLCEESREFSVRVKLGADWVVLSACNTAAGDKPGAEALSGLAKAFFYAGTARCSSRTGRSRPKPARLW